MIRHPAASAIWTRVVGVGRSPALWIASVAFVIRGAICVFNLDRFEADPDAYRAIAETLGLSGVFGLTTPSGDVVSTAFRPPLYPYLLSWVASDGSLNNVGIAFLHAILGGLTACFTYLASSSWLGRGRVGFPSILAALIVIVDPILIQQSTLVMTETLATAIVGAVLWWWMCHVSIRLTMLNAGILGGWLALAYLCRPTFLVWGAMLVVCLCFSNAPSGVSRSRRMMAAGLTGLVLLAAISMWTIRNVAVLGHPIWATTHGGYTLLLGNNPLFYRHVRESGPFRRWDPSSFLNAYAHRYEGDVLSEEYWFVNWDTPVLAQPELSAALTEHDDDILTYQAARATISRDRNMFLISSLVRVYKLWTPFPYATEGRSGWKLIVIGSYYSFLYAAAFVGLKRLGTRWRSSVWWPLPTLVLTLTLVHAVYWSNMRMRAPAIPVIAMLAAASFHKPERASE